MKLKHVEMPPFNTTLMGVLAGVLNYFQHDVSAAMAFGLSGQAFFINIHKQLCPSGPYCWNYAWFEKLIQNMGVERQDLGFFGPDSSTEDRNAVEQKLRIALDEGNPCSLLNMENQLITGYNENGFFTAQPWKCNTDFPPASLSFGSWRELGQEVHIAFYTYQKKQPKEEVDAMVDSLAYAMDLQRNPKEFTYPDYTAGPGAYDAWIAAVPEHGASHGHWWNATVWSECRAMASAYFAEISATYPAFSKISLRLSDQYARIGEMLSAVSDKAMDPQEKIAILKRIKVLEETAIEGIGELQEMMASAVGA